MLARASCESSVGCRRAALVAATRAPSRWLQSMRVFFFANEGEKS